MFKGLGNLASLMKQAHEMQSRMSEIQEKLGDLRVDAVSGGGLVKVEITGQQRVTRIEVDESLTGEGDRELLEDLLVAAVNQALDKSREVAAEQMSGLAGGLDIPGLGDALSRMGTP